MDASSDYSRGESPLRDRPASSHDEEYLAFVSQLMAEKDRLITEKDELVESKDRLWREMHAMVLEKEQQISQLTAGHTWASRVRDDRFGAVAARELRNEVQRLKNRNDELETALRKMLNANQNAEEDEEDDENDEVDSMAVTSTFKRDGSQSLSLSFGHDEYSSGTSGQFSSGTLAGSMSGRSDHIDSLRTHTPLPLGASQDATERVELMSRPLNRVKILPVIESADHTKHTFADFSELSPTIQSIINETLGTMSPHNRFVGLSHKGSRRCAYSFLVDSQAVWTIEQPRCFACKRCFNKRQPCLHPLGKHQWALLPLPPSVRDSNATWQDEAYYVYAEEHASPTFLGVWSPH